MMEGLEEKGRGAMIKKDRNYGYGMILGLLCGIGFGFMGASIYEGLFRNENVEGYMLLSFLAWIAAAAIDTRISSQKSPATDSN
jgi:O-antigen/teichoic acid export membrane protein